jgi:hypothetical protein
VIISAYHGCHQGEANNDIAGKGGQEHVNGVFPGSLCARAGGAADSGAAGEVTLARRQMTRQPQAAPLLRDDRNSSKSPLGFFAPIYTRLYPHEI